MTENKQDTITVELPIRAGGDGRVEVLTAALTRRGWRDAAAHPNEWLPTTAALAPAVVAWIECDEFKPLDVPDVGRTIKATLRDGRVETFEVGSVGDYGSGWVAAYPVNNPHVARYIERRYDPELREHHDIVAWEYVDEPAVDLVAIADKIAAAVNELREAIK